MSRKPPPRHSKPRRAPAARTGGHARHCRPSPAAAALRRRPARAGALAAVAAAVIIVPALELVHWSAPGSGPSAQDQEIGGSLNAGSRDTGDGPLAGATPTASATASQPPGTAPATSPASPSPSAPGPAYRNPLRDVRGLILERIDMGVDFGGAGPVFAIGDAVITNATSESGGWPGGGWITYRVTEGPAAGLQVYVAEDVTPAVSVGQHVTSDTVIANMFNGGDGIETGWAQPDGSSAESQLSAAGGISGSGPFPTDVGLNFDALLQALGVPPAPNSNQQGNGLLPSVYPSDWTAALKADR